MSTVAPPVAPPSRAQIDSEGFIDQQIGRTRRALKLVDFLAGVITLSIGLLGFILLAALLDHWVLPGGLNEGGRAALFGLLALALAWYLWRQFVPLLRPINPVYAAHTIEQNSPSLKNSLLNAVLFRTHRDMTSARIYHALERQAAERLSAASVEATVDQSVLLRLGYALLAVVALAAVYSLLSPKNLATSAVRVLAPWTDVAAPSRVQIEDVKPGDASVALGERLMVSATIRGLRDGEKVQVRYSSADKQTVDELAAMSAVEGSDRFETHLPRRGGATTGVQQDLTYWLEAGDARSKPFTVTVFQRPTMVVEKIRYEYPSYTGLPSKEVESTGDVRGIEGTRVVIAAIANTPIKSVFIDFNADGRHDVKMNADGTKATASFELKLKEDRRTPLHGSYVLRFTTADGRSNENPPKYQIEVTPDYAPEVEITRPEEPEHSARFDEVVPISVEARDPDFALREVQLVGKVGERDFVLATLPADDQQGRFESTELFTPGDAQLKPGDVLEYWAEARDNRRPEANVAFSEHRRLKIVGDPPQGQPQAGQQRPQQEEPQNDGGAGGESGQAGGEGDPQQSGGAGEAGQEQSGEEDSKQGAGASGGGESGEQNQNSDGQSDGGGAGQASQSPAGQPQQKSGGGQGGGGNKSEAGDEQQPGDSSGAGGAEQGEQAGDVNQQSQQRPGDNGNEGGSNDAEAGESAGGSAGGQSGKVSSAGDNDAEAFQKMAEHLNEPNVAERQPGGEQPSAGEQGGAEQAGRQTPGESSDQSQQGRQAAEQKPGNQQKPGSQANGGDKSTANERSGSENEEQQLNQGGADATEEKNGAQRGEAGRSQKGTGQKPPAEGASSAGPQEDATSAEQQTAAAEDNPSKLEGADKPREGQNGDGAARPKEGGESPMGDGASNPDRGEAGSGHPSDEDEAASSLGAAPKKDRQKPADENEKLMGDKEPPSSSSDNRETDSKGGQGGDMSGGGQNGGGQKADAEGKGKPGQHEPADEGSGTAKEQGRGETGSKAGDQQLADRETGQSSGEQPGQGSESGAAASDPAAQPTGGDEESGGQGSSQAQQPGGEPGADSSAGEPSAGEGSQPTGGEQPQPGDSPAGAEEPPGKSGQPGRPPSAPKPGEPQPKGAAGEQQKPGGEQPSAEQNAGDRQPDQQHSESGQQASNPTGQPGASGAQPAGGGTGVSQGAGAGGGELQPGDAANLEYAQKRTDLVLQRLDEQLAKKKVDPALLNSLGWSEEELRAFVDRWKGLKMQSQEAGDEGDKAREELDASLRALGDIRPGRQQFRAANKEDEVRDLNDAYRAKPPAAYADRVREYLKGVSGDDK